ncbi:MAG: sel1 repeat family protein [Candidatus Methanomethylophilaceae archaeon]|nr:sel1 repeat family protein [Candidatus Methanomethylophilaceae archaeon]
MAKHTFNVLGSRFFKDALAGCDSVEVKGSVTGINPACISQGEMETLSSDKGDWIFIDTAYISCGANGEDSASDIDALARFLKKGWGRKIIVAIARPSAYRMGESALYPIRCRHDPAAEALAAKLAESSKAYVITMPFDCVSSDFTPFHYIPCISDYIRGVVSVVAEKYDRNAIDALAIRCASEISGLLEDTEAGACALKKAYGEAIAEGDRIEACSICVELACRGDMGAAAESEHAYNVAVRRGAAADVRLKWLRSLSSIGIRWAKYALFNMLWRTRSKESDEELVKVVCGPAKEGDGVAMKLLGRAYRDGRGVKKDLDKALELTRKSVALKTPLARNELFDVLLKIDTPESYEEMVKIIKTPASLEEPGAMYRLGCAYRDGKGVKKNLKKAKELFAKAADKDPVYKKGLDSLEAKS